MAHRLCSLALRAGVRRIRVLAVLLLAAAPASASFVTFESGPVRPLALSPDGSRLFAVNTPDNHLEIFAVGAGGLTHVQSVPVGMEPVAVAPRSNTEIWVLSPGWQSEDHSGESLESLLRSAPPSRYVPLHRPAPPSPVRLRAGTSAGTAIPWR